jgi:hypothetical protein
LNICSNLAISFAIIISATPVFADADNVVECVTPLPADTPAEVFFYDDYAYIPGQGRLAAPRLSADGWIFWPALANPRSPLRRETEYQHSTGHETSNVPVVGLPSSIFMSVSGLVAFLAIKYRAKLVRACIKFI